MFKEIFTKSEQIIIEGYNLQDVISFLQKEKVPHKVSNDIIQVPSRFFDQVEKAVEKFKGKIEQFDAGDHTVIKRV